MSRRTDMDMTVGKPLSIILKFTWPLFLGNIIQQLYNIVDTIIVGRFVGDRALAAVGSTGTLMFLFIGVANGMVTGFSVLTSQRYGAKEEEGVKKTFTNGIYLCILLATIQTMFSIFFLKPLLIWMNTPDTIFDYAYAYISTITLGITATVFNNYFASLLRAIGNSKMPLFFLMMSAGINIVLDLVFIIVFGWETFGAAIATVISQACSAVAGACYCVFRVPVLRPSLRHWKIHWTTARKQFILGLPMALVNGITASGTVIMQSAINLFGAVAVTAITAANKFSSIINMGMFSIGQTMPAYVGQNTGARKMDRIKDGIKAAMKIFSVYSVAAAVLVICLTPTVMQIFFPTGTDISVYIPYAMIYIVESAVCYIALAMIFIFRSSMQGAGFAFMAMSVGIAEFFVRLICSSLSKVFNNYYLAVGCDPIAWIAGGLLGMILANIVFRKLARSWREETQSL